MANYPSTFSGQFGLQPGARGEQFGADLPGYRNQGDNRVNRTNMKLNTCTHDVPNIKYELDRRLPVIFRYGFAYGFNQVIIPKGRIVAADPNVNYMDWDLQKDYNALTLANGGENVKLADHSTLWEKATASVDYTEDKGKAKIDDISGKVLDASGKPTDKVRAANIPLGIIMRNEYTRNDNAYNGMMPGGIQTDCLVEIPWFGDKKSAEENPWGAAYGDFKPGILVKSDCNGRFVPSPLNDPENDVFKDIKAYEKERIQVIGQVYSTCADLVPAGSAIYAQWALSDRLNFNETNPAEWRQNYRDGEDAVNNSPFKSTGKYPGYPYEKGYMAHDLHMISERTDGAGGIYDPRMNQEFQLDNGIPGLTDGKNAVKKIKLNTKGGTIGPFSSGAKMEKGTPLVFRTLDVDVEKIVLSEKPLTDESAFNNAQPVKVGDKFLNKFVVNYVDEKQGIVGLMANDDVEESDLASGTEVVDQFGQKLKQVTLYFSYAKRGQAGVATNVDWEGCKGTIKILLQK